MLNPWPTVLKPDTPVPRTLNSASAARFVAIDAVYVKVLSASAFKASLSVMEIVPIPVPEIVASVCIGLEKAYRKQNQSSFYHSKQRSQQPIDLQSHVRCHNH